MLRLRCVNWIWFWNVLDIWECAGKDVLKSPACKACNGGPPLIYSFLCSLLFFSCSLPLSFHVTICTRCMQADVYIYIYIHIHRCMHIYIDYIYILRRVIPTFWSCFTCLFLGPQHGLWGASPTATLGACGQCAVCRAAQIAQHSRISLAWGPWGGPAAFIISICCISDKVCLICL